MQAFFRWNRLVQELRISIFTPFIASIFMSPAVQAASSSPPRWQWQNDPLTGELHLSLMKENRQIIIYSNRIHSLSPEGLGWKLLSTKSECEFKVLHFLLREIHCGRQHFSLEYDGLYNLELVKKINDREPILRFQYDEALDSLTEVQESRCRFLISYQQIAPEVQATEKRKICSGKKPIREVLLLNFKKENSLFVKTGRIP